MNKHQQTVVNNNNYIIIFIFAVPAIFVFSFFCLLFFLVFSEVIPLPVFLLLLPFVLLSMDSCKPFKLTADSFCHRADNSKLWHSAMTPSIE